MPPSIPKQLGKCALVYHLQIQYKHSFDIYKILLYSITTDSVINTKPQQNPEAVEFSFKYLKCEQKKIYMDETFYLPSNTLVVMHFHFYADDTNIYTFATSIEQAVSNLHLAFLFRFFKDQNRRTRRSRRFQRSLKLGGLGCFKGV